MKQKLRVFLTLLLCVVASVGWSEEITYTFQSKSWTAVLGSSTTFANWNSGKDGSGFTASQGVQVTTSTSGANATSPDSYANISKIVVVYNTNKTAGKGAIKIQVGDNEEKSNNVAYSGTGDGRTANYTTEFGNINQSGNVKLTVTCSTNSIYVHQIIITYNEGGSAETVATPTFSPAAGTYTEAQNVTLSCSTDGSSIYYTTDGSEPSSASTLYENAINVTFTTTIKAIAVKNGMNNSAVASATYTIVEPFVIEDGIFDFESKRSDYGSGVSTTSANEYIEEDKTWTAGNVTLVTSGKYRWWDNDGTLRFYSNNPASAMTFSVPEGKVIKSIVITGGQNFTANVGTYTSGTWTGQAQTVTLSYAASSGSVNVKTITVTYGDPENVKVDIATINGISPVELTVGDNGDFTLDATFAEGVTDEDYTIAWASENTDVVGLDGKAYEAKAAGTANVTVTITPNDTETYNTVTKTFAVTVKEEEVAGNWVLTSLADLTSTDVFVIVGNNGDNYALANDKGTSAAPTAVAVTVSDGYITSDVTNIIKWNISGNATDGYTFNPYGSTTTWLYCFSNNNGLRVGTGDDKTFVIKDDYIYNSGQERYIGIYNSADWRSYTSINNNIKDQTFAFYKFEAGSPVPSITANNVEIAYSATSGEIEYSINNPADNGQLKATSTSDWLTLGTNITSPIAFTCSANETRIARTADVVLTYTYGEGSSVSKTVTVTQAGNPNVVDNISDINTIDGNYAVRGTVVAKNAKALVLGDGTGYVYYYKGSEVDYDVNDILKISGTVGSHGNMYQFTSTATIETAENSNYNNTPAVNVLDAEAIGAYSEGFHLSDYVQFEGTLVKSGNYYNIQVNGLETDASISYPTDEQKTALDNLENKNVVVKGYFSGVSGGHFSIVLVSIEEATKTVEVTISDAGYSTLYYGTKNLEVPTGMEAYTVKVTTQVERSKTYRAGNVIPSGTGVVLKANAGTYEFVATTTAGEVDNDNMLRGSDKKAMTTGGTYYYALTLNANKDIDSAGFYWMREGGAAYEAGAHKAYLALDQTFAQLGGAKSYLALPGDDTDGIGQMQNAEWTMENAAIYNLAGQRVNKAQKGIYIVNGKKVVIK